MQELSFLVDVSLSVLKRELVFGWLDGDDGLVEFCEEGVGLELWNTVN